MKMAWNDFAKACVKDRGLTLIGATLAGSVGYAAFYTGFLAVKGPEVCYKRASNPEPWVHYGTDYNPKFPSILTTGELDSSDKPRAGPAEAWDAVKKFHK